jgi:hypothetical protein
LSAWADARSHEVRSCAGFVRVADLAGDLTASFTGQSISEDDSA